MSGGALALALGAAVLHAAWNVLLAGTRDPLIAAGALLAWGTLLLAPAALVTGGVSSEAVPFVAASAVLELSYFVLLARAYRDGELGVVYPVARGSAPVVVLALGVFGLGEGVGWLAAAGVVLVAAGVSLLAPAPEVRRETRATREKLAKPRRGPRPDVLFGLAIGLTIAGYTLVDSEGLEHARPLAYLFLVTAPCALVYCGALVASRRGAELRAALDARAALTAAATFGAYAMVLGALELAPPAPVAAVRESSVVIAALLAWLFLGEPRRLGPAALVAAGVAAIALA
jgi:drug/metabolite transporter (DMT)-like permease